MAGQMVRLGERGWRIGALLAVVVLLWGASPAASLDSTDFTGDVQPPQVMSFTLSPAGADVTNAAANLTVTMRITDDLSGVSDFPQLTWHPPGPEPKISFGGGLTLMSGTRNDGIWTGSIVVDRYAPPGWYTLQVAVPDRVGNWRSFEPA